MATKEIMPKKMMYRIIRRIYLIVKCLVFVWPPYLKQNLTGIRYLPYWLFTTIPIRDNVKDKIPWLPFGAIEWLDNYLKPEIKVFEWGSGGSTIFIARKILEFVSIEHNKKWHDKIKARLISGHCKYLLKENMNDYLQAIDNYPDNYFDLVVIDGGARVKCVLRAMEKVKPKGYLLLDDTEYGHYSEATRELKGWKETIFKGPKPYKLYFSQTSIFQKL